ncbi:MAG: hypothetical protein IH840_03475 [Candidatus Heimdallarchaeota archaeon]|nr:hypothetical protein [Candidatus Heimdallarchaeota archaeon]
MWLLSKDQQYRGGDLESLHEVKQLIMDDIRKLRLNKNNTFVLKKIKDVPVDNLETTKTGAKQAKELI